MLGTRTRIYRVIAVLRPELHHCFDTCPVLYIITYRRSSKTISHLRRSRSQSFLTPTARARLSVRMAEKMEGVESAEEHNSTGPTVQQLTDSKMTS